MKKLLLVADISNLYYTANKKFGQRVSYKQLLDYVKSTLGDFDFYRCIGYGAEFDNQASAFKSALSKLGFELKYKTPKVYPGAGEKSEIRKADWDVGIAIDVVRILDCVDAVAICTGDGDMTPVVEYIQSKGKLAYVFGCGISRELREAANGNFELSDAEME